MNRLVSLCLSGVVVLSYASTVRGAEGPEPGWLAPAAMNYHILQVENAPDVDAADPMADPAWKAAEPLGPFFRLGQPEDPSRATTVRMLSCKGKLYVAARCLDPQPDKIKAGQSFKDIWLDDSLELTFTRSLDQVYPYAHLQLNAAALFGAARHIQPFSFGRGPLKQAIDISPIRVRTGTDDRGWWAVAVIALESLQIQGDAFRANITRNRPADGSDYAWCDLWGGSVYNARRFQPMRIVDVLPPAPPRLHVPAGLRVGENRLRWDNWRADCTLLHNGDPVAVLPSGDCVVRVEQRGTANLRLVSAKGQPLVEYTAEVLRPLLIEAAEPFQEDTTRPVVVNVTLNVASPPLEVKLEGLQGGKVVGGTTVSLGNGTHAVELACDAAKPGEVTIIASANLPAARKPLTLRAEHWCVLGQTRQSWDRFRDGLADLPTLSLYRAALADACNLFHVTQAGDGLDRAANRASGRVRSSQWNFSMVYPFALVYTADWPENPYRGDPRMLASAVASMEAALAPEIWHQWMRQPPNRHLQAALLAYDLLKDKVPADLAAYWKDRLTRMVECVVDLWIEPSTNQLCFFSKNTGTGTNHYAYHLANVYTAGMVFGRQDWLELGQQMMRRLAAHEREGFYPEQRAGVVIHYTWLTLNGVGQYYWQSGDERVLPHLLRCVDFAWRISLPGEQTVILHDSRNNEPSAWACGEFVLSLTPQGRHLARQRMLHRIASGRISRSNSEFWFRTAENATYFRPGDEKAPPAEYVYEFLDGQGVIARTKGFTYGMSAICARPTDETYRVDQQNVVELNHNTVGRILSGANSQQQPEAGSFCRQLKDRTVFLPWEGSLERTAHGHAARLVFDTFEAQVVCEVLSAQKARITVQLLQAEGDEPVVYSFFPAAAGIQDLAADGPIDTLALTDVTIRCSQPVHIQRDFKIMDPYSQTLRVTSKPVRAYTTLRVDKPLVVEVEIDSPAQPAAQSGQ